MYLLTGTAPQESSRRKGIVVAVALVTVLLLHVTSPSSGTAHAEAPYISTAAADGPPLGQFISVWNDGVDNHQPAIAYNPQHGEYLIVWWNDRGATRDIYARRVASDGSILSWFSVISMPNKWNWLPDVAYNPQQDEYMVVYTRKETTSDYNIYARRIAWDGSLISADIAVSTKSGKQWYPAVAYNMTNNEFLVVYENYWSATLRDIDAQRVKGQDGALVNPPRNIATAPNTIRRLPAVAYNEGRNQYLIGYTCMVSPTADGDICAKTTSANMGALSSEINLVNNTFHQDNLTLTAGADEYLAIWEDGPGSGHNTLYGRRIDGDGALSPYITIRDQVNNVYFDPVVSFSPLHGYVAAWCHASSNPSGDDIYARIIKPHTNITGDIFALDKSVAAQRSPALACAESGDCLFVDEDDTSGNYDIWARKIDVERLFVPNMRR